jgi:hypothetical protein
MSGPRGVDTRVRHCYKCGREIGSDATICDVCNRAGMATPSATQYHGTIVVAIIGGVALLALAASLSMRGIGPYRASTIAFRADGQGTVLATVQVSNEGSKEGRAKCQLTARDAAGNALGVASAVSPPVGAEATVSFDQSIPGIANQPATISVACQ